MGRYSLFFNTSHACSSMTINKDGICTALHKGFHNNSNMNMLNHNVQTHEWEGLLYTGIFVVIKHI